MTKDYNLRKSAKSVDKDPDEYPSADYADGRRSFGSRRKRVRVKIVISTAMDAD